MDAHGRLLADHPPAAIERNVQRNPQKCRIPEDNLKQSWIALFLMIFGSCHLWAYSARQDHSMHEGHQGHISAVTTPEDHENSAKLLADKKESEFNHHVAGLFVVLAGVFILAQGALINRWPWTKY